MLLEIKEYMERMDLSCQVTIIILGREHNEKVYKIKQKGMSYNVWMPRECRGLKT